MADQIPLTGIRLFKKKDNQPDFVIADGVITPDDLNAFLIDNAKLQTEYQGKKQLRIQVLVSKAGNPYIAVNTYNTGQEASPAPASQQGFPATEPLPDDSALPF